MNQTIDFARHFGLLKRAFKLIEVANVAGVQIKPWVEEKHYLNPQQDQWMYECLFEKFNDGIRNIHRDPASALAHYQQVYPEKFGQYELKEDLIINSNTKDVLNNRRLGLAAAAILTMTLAKGNDFSKSKTYGLLSRALVHAGLIFADNEHFNFGAFELQERRIQVLKDGVAGVWQMQAYVRVDTTADLPSNLDYNLPDAVITHEN